MVVTVGVCCMDVKLFSRPMAAILNRLRRFAVAALPLFCFLCSVRVLPPPHTHACAHLRCIGTKT